MTSVTYGKCYLWQRYYGKNNMANETEPFLDIPLFAYLLKQMFFKKIYKCNLQGGQNVRIVRIVRILFFLALKLYGLYGFFSNCTDF